MNRKIQRIILTALIFLLSLTVNPFRQSVSAQDAGFFPALNRTGSDDLAQKLKLRTGTGGTYLNSDELESFESLSASEKQRFLQGLSAEERVRIFEKLSETDRGALFGFLGDAEKQGVFNILNDTDKIKLFRSLNNTDRKSLFNILDEQDKRIILNSLQDYEKADLINALDEQEKPKWLKRYPDLEFGTGPQQAPARGTTETGIAPSEIEKMLSGQFPTEISRDLRQFGYDYFDKTKPGFEPLTNIPVSPDYVVGPGDSFKINLWGKTELSYYVTVDTDGSINLPRLGTLDVAGLTFKEMKSFLRKKFQEYYSGFEMSLTMGTVGTTDIFMVGEVENPGTLAVSSLSTAITAVFAAGGPTKKGSLRNIKVLRDGSPVAELDLYDFFIRGTKNHDIRLQTGDTIFVPVIGPVVGLAGCVKRPAIYELKNEQTLGDLIQLAGGILVTGRIQNIVIERIKGHQRRVIKSFNLDPANDQSNKNLDLKLQDTDLVKIYPIFEELQKVVYLEGHVKYPREHEWFPGMKLKDVITSYDDLLPEPYLPQAEIIRSVPPDMHTEIVEFNLGQLLAGDEQENLALQDQDRVRVYDKWDKKEVPQVRIQGAVLNPGTYRLYEGMTAKDLIFQAGNMTDTAFRERATLTRILTGEGEAEITRIDISPLKAMQGDKEDNIVLQKNDILHIREIPQYHQVLQRKIVLEGEFVFPGEYTFSEGERISSLIERAGGLTEEAYPSGAVFLRQSARVLQKERLNDYISQLERDVISISTQSAETSLDATKASILQKTLAGKQALLEKLRQSEPTGRMIINLSEVLILPTSKYNFQLRPGDKLTVNKRPDYVNAIGEVYNQTAIYYEEGRSLRHYLNLVGGMTPNADRGQLYVVRADGTVISKTQSGWWGLANWDNDKQRWTTGRFESIDLKPGDTIIAPRKVETFSWMSFGKDISQVLYQLAVSAGVLKSSLGLF